MRRPKPVKVEPFTAYATRKPCKSDPRWAWRVRETGRSHVDVWSGRATRDEVLERLRGLRPGVESEDDQGVDTVRDLLLNWLADQKHRRDVVQDLSPASYRVYFLSAKNVARTIGDVRLTQVTSRTLSVLGVQHARDYAPNTVEQHVKTLRMAWRWSHDRGLTPGPLPTWSAPKRDRTVRPTPTEAEALLVLEELRNGPAWQAMAYLVALSTGARIHEIAALTSADVEPTRVRLHRKGSGGNRKPVVWVPTPLGLYPELRPLLGAPDDRIWPVTFSTMRHTDHITRACRALGVVPHGWHGPRRLASCRLIEAGVDRKTYEAIMGHSYEIGLRIYAQARHTQQAAEVLGFAVPTQVIDLDAERKARGPK